MINWIDEVPGTVEGTPVNRAKLMDMQGFCNCSTDFSSDYNTIVYGRLRYG